MYNLVKRKKEKCALLLVVINYAFITTKSRYPPYTQRHPQKNRFLGKPPEFFLKKWRIFHDAKYSGLKKNCWYSYSVSSHQFILNIEKNVLQFYYIWNFKKLKNQIRNFFDDEKEEKNSIFKKKQYTTASLLPIHMPKILTTTEPSKTPATQRKDTEKKRR